MIIGIMFFIGCNLLGGAAFIEYNSYAPWLAIDGVALLIIALLSYLNGGNSYD